MIEKNQKKVTANDMSNIIADMTMNRATKEELHKVIEESKVVIDAEKGFWKKYKKTVIPVITVTAGIIASGLLVYKFGSKKGTLNGFNVGSEMGRYDILRWMNHIKPTVDHIEIYETYYKNHMDEFHFIPNKLVDKIVKES